MDEPRECAKLPATHPLHVRHQNAAQSRAAFLFGDADWHNPHVLSGICLGSMILTSVPFPGSLLKRSWPPSRSVTTL